MFSIDDLGYRRPSREEQVAAWRRLGIGRPSAMLERPPPRQIPAAILRLEPLIVYCGIVPGAPLGLASLVPRAFSRRRAAFLISPTWTIETPAQADEIRAHAIIHRRLNPEHLLIFLGNSPGEVALLQARGEAALFHNKTSTVSEALFRPLEGAAIEFEAIYNARLSAWKRHELTLEIERCAFLFYRDSETEEMEQQLIARHRALAPGHVFINEIRDGVPNRLSAPTVNRWLNRAAVGLCLSAAEGAMFASMEYLMAGLPIVSTPSIGGRDVYFDEAYCTIVPPDPRAVRDAVAALAARGIPRQHVRRRTLERVERDRARFVDLVNGILAEAGAPDRLAPPWPFAKPMLVSWQNPQAVIAQIEAGEADDLGERKS